ncbi:MAG: hypothetical protein QM589_07070 [Thermomicrobiales bacterium]
MDPRRFDSLTRAFSSRFSRRAAVRTGGVGVAAALAASAGMHSSRSVTAQTGTPYSVLRMYAFDETPDTAVEALNTGYLPQLQQQTGFLQYTVVVSDQNVLTTISVFDSQANFTAAAEALASWIEENLGSVLPDLTDSSEGNAVIFALNTNQVCGSGPAPAATPTAAPVNPTAVPASPEACTGAGCACNGGVQNACDDGLVCCQSGESIPGGAGICTAEDSCNDSVATPVS